MLCAGWYFPDWKSVMPEETYKDSELLASNKQILVLCRPRNTICQKLLLRAAVAPVLAILHCP